MAEEAVREAVAELGKEVTVIKVSNITEIAMAGIMSTPAVAVDGKIKSTGKVPSKDEIKSWIDGAAVQSAPTASGGCCGGAKCC
jgi:small redox-active disulfide protein 2